MLKSYPLNILKVQSKSPKISNRKQMFILLKIVPLIIHMNHFSYPITTVQINIFEEPQNIFSQPKSQTPNYRANLPVFLTTECPLGLLHNKFKKPKQNLTDIPPPANVSHANTKIKRYYFCNVLKIFYHTHTHTHTRTHTHTNTHTHGC